MNRLTCILSTLLLAIAAATAHAGDWITLFDGSSTHMWRGYRQAAFPNKGWVVENGAMRTIAGAGGGDIVTKDRFENFELTLEFRVTENANSGIMYRVTEEGGASWNTGPEYQILDDVGHGLATDDINSAGALYDLKRPSADKKPIVKPTGQWNEARILMNNGRVEHWLNGVKVVEDDLNSDNWRSRVASSKFNAYEGFGVRTRGHIALQEHGNEVWFRNIKIRDLNAPSHSAVTPVPREDGWWTDRHDWMNDRVKQGNVDLLFIGDSITQGWENEGSGVWLEVFAPLNAINLGIGGDRTQHVLWRLENGNIDGISPKVAVVMIGTNNSNGEDNTVAEIADGVRAIVNILRDRLPDTHILLLDIFPRGHEPNPQRGKIAQVNQLLAQMDDGHAVCYHPIGHRFLNPDGSLPAEIMPDFLHLSPKGYAIWAEAIEGKLKEFLGE